MSTITPTPPGSNAFTEASAPRSRRGTPVWEVASLYPLQGHWEEQDYLALETNHLVEFDDGYVEFLPMPTRTHQLLLLYLCDQLREHLRRQKVPGTVLVAPYRVRLRPGKYREPDIVFVGPQHEIQERFCTGADLVVEILSEGRQDRARDLEEKRAEYAAAGIREYWIVDPQQRTVSVLVLDGDHYRLHGEFRPGAAARSVLLAGFTVEVTDCFAVVDQS